MVRGLRMERMSRASLLFLMWAGAAHAQEADRMPDAPARVAASYTPPPRDAAGRYVTPNRDLTPAETSWHLRAALNVAALRCRGADEAERVAGYNAMLAAARGPLAEAAAGTEAVYRARHGARWQAASDDAMTRLYNFFAQPEAAGAFCAAALTATREAAAVEPSDFHAFAQRTLARLETPFLDFYASWDRYRASLTAWQGRHPAATPAVAVTFAAATSASAGPAMVPAVVPAVAAPAALPVDEPGYVTVMVPVRVAVPPPAVVAPPATPSPATLAAVQVARFVGPLP